MIKLAFVYKETDNDFEPIATLYPDDRTNKLWSRSMKDEDDWTYRMAINNYNTWEDMRGYGD